MSINLLDMVQSQLGGAAMSQIGKFLGTDATKASEGMSAALPAILGSVVQKGSSESGAKGILDLLNSGGHNGSMFDNLGALLGGGNATNSMMNNGGSILQFLMGNKTQAITDFIIRSTGLDKGATGSILRMAAPMIMGMIGKQVSKSGMGASGLMDMLSGQKSFLKDAMPAGMGSLLGFSGFPEAAKETMNRTADTAKAAASEGSSMLSRILPLALILGLCFAGYKYFTSGENVIADATNATIEKTKDAANAVGDAAGDAASVVAATAEGAADAVGDAASATGDAIGDAANKTGEVLGDAANAVTTAAKNALANVKFAAGSAGEKMANMLGTGEAAVGKTVAFKNLTFETGSSNIDPTTATEVENLAQVLKAYPNVKIEIGGHTDNTGDAAKNLALSNDRASAVAKYLVRKGGIDRSRISTFGYGDGKPVADNGTKEGRAQNRRIEVKIIE